MKPIPFSLASAESNDVPFTSQFTYLESKVAISIISYLHIFKSYSWIRYMSMSGYDHNIEFLR